MMNTIWWKQFRLSLIVMARCLETAGLVVGFQELIIDEMVTGSWVTMSLMCMGCEGYLRKIMLAMIKSTRNLFNVNKNIRNILWFVIHYWNMWKLDICPNIFEFSPFIDDYIHYTFFHYVNNKQNIFLYQIIN